MKSIKDMIYGKPVREAYCNEDDLILINNVECRVLDKAKLKTKSIIDERSVRSDIVENRVLLHLEDDKEVKVFNYETKKELVKIAAEDITAVKMSTLLVALGFKDGKVTIYSITGNKLLMNFNIFKNKVERLDFYNQKFLEVQNGNIIKVIDIIEKKVVLSIHETSVITSLAKSDDYYFTTNLDKELQIYSTKSGKLLHQLKLNYEPKKMVYDDGYIYILHEDGLNILKLTLKEDEEETKEESKKEKKEKIRVLQKRRRRDIDKDIINLEQFNLDQTDYNIIQFAVCEDDLFVMDSEHDIHHFSVDSIINAKVETKEEQKEEVEEEVDNIEDSKYKIKFLTVDDSMTMRLIIKNTLLKNFKNIEVYEADDGYKCLDVLKEHPDIDVIFMDWNMPNLNGADTVDKIREKDIYKHIKIIMATTEGAKDKVRQMISKGVKGYLVKPFKPETIVPLATKMIEIIKEERNV